MNSKKCSTCKEEFPFASFHTDKTKTLGIASRCKSCCKKYDKIRNSKPERIEYRKAYMESYRESNGYKEALPKYKEDSLEKKMATGKKYRKSFPNKYKAHMAVSTAIKSGKLVRCCCEACGGEFVHAHHDDYSKPLNIRWLCPKHHKQWHKENGEGLNAR